MRWLTASPRWGVPRGPERPISPPPRSCRRSSPNSIGRWSSSACSRVIRSARTTADVRHVVALVAVLPIVAQAAPTGLNQIPTPDFVPVSQLSVQLQNGNTEVSGPESVFHQPQPVPQSEYGLPWNAETGLDVAPSNPPGDYRPILNLKWNPLHED